MDPATPLASKVGLARLKLLK